jgi:hypothetical protein
MPVLSRRRDRDTLQQTGTRLVRRHARRNDQAQRRQPNARPRRENLIEQRHMIFRFA